MKTISNLQYLAAARRAEIDRANRSSRSRIKKTRRHERQALQHDRKVELLTKQILEVVNSL